jgi:hypothetical protein
MDYEGLPKLWPAWLFAMRHFLLPWHYRVDPHQFYAGLNFGDMTFHWDVGPPTVEFQIVGKDGQTKLRHTVAATRPHANGHP